MHENRGISGVTFLGTALSLPPLLGEHCKLHQHGLGLQPKLILVHFSQKIWHSGWPLVWKTWKCRRIWQLSAKCQGFYYYRWNKQNTAESHRLQIYVLNVHHSREHMHSNDFWASDLMLCFVCFIDTGFRKYDWYKHVQSANIGVKCVTFVSETFTWYGSNITNVWW